MRIYKATLLFLLNLLFLCVGFIISLLPAGKRRLQMSSTLMSLWARSACAILGIRIRRTGLQPFLRGSFIVANHCSYLDILVLGSLIPGVFVAKQEVAAWPVIGRLSRFAGTIFVDRGSRSSTLTVFPLIESTLKSDVDVILFPEGTTNNGESILTFKSSFFKVPIETRRPVQPVSLIYSHINGEAVRKVQMDKIAWYGNMSFFPHLWNILGIRRIDVGVKFNPVIHGSATPDSSHTRKSVSLSAHESIRSGYDSLLIDGRIRQLNLEL